MKSTADDLPKKLRFFVTDTGVAVHNYSGVIEDDHSDERVRRVYKPDDGNSIEKLYIGHYELVRVEAVGR